jgi:Domain of unknown function (DUF1707)/2TM domain
MDREPGDQRRASLRASDADREQFVEALRRHQAEGRLTTEELAERTERAYAARTFGDLDALATDLPPLWPPTSASRQAPPGHAGPPGASRAPGDGRPAGYGGPVAPGPPPGGRPPAPTQAEAKAALYRSVLWFGGLAVFLVVIWAMTNFGGYFWPIWPILGFAIAVGWQAFNVYGPRPPGQPRP